VLIHSAIHAEERDVASKKQSFCPSGRIPLERYACKACGGFVL
jgi:hypothetical protein